MRDAQPIDLSQGPVALGRYVLLSTLGRGGMSVVYSAYDEALERKVAIKVLRAADELGRLRLRREAQALAQLAHPNVVRVYEIGELDELDYIVMELVEGVTLHAWRERGSRELGEILTVYAAAGRGLASAHAKGIVHRDFKPENAMIRADGQVLVMDFGLARDGRDATTDVDAHPLGERTPDPDPAPDPAPADDRPSGRLRSSSPALTRVGAVMGTLGYMAPEQVLGRLADDRSDQFSFCVSLWEAIHGQRPFPTTDIRSYREAVLEGRPRAPSTDAAPPWLRAVLERGLAPDPADRWPSMDALLDALTRDPSRSRRRWLLGAATLALAGVTAAGLWGVERRSEAERAAACEARERAVTDLWSADRAATLERRFLASGDPLAASSWAATEPWLDAFAGQLGRLRGDNCRAATLDETRSPTDATLVDACLDDGEARFEALLAVFAEANPAVIEHAAEAATSLPPLADCADERKQARLLHAPAPMIDELQAIERRLYRVEALRRTGDYATAERETAAALAEAEALDWPPVIGEALLLDAELAVESDDLGEAIAATERAFRVAAVAGDAIGMLAAAVARTRLAAVDNQFEQASAWAATADQLLADTELDGSAFAGELAAIRARLELDRGDTEAARTAATRALTIFEANFGPEHPRLSEPLTIIGNALDVDDQRDLSQAYYERALAITLSAYGPDSPLLIESYNNIGGMHHTAGRPVRAREYYLRALAVVERIHGPDHSRAGSLLCNLGLLAYESDADLEVAQDYFERGTAVLEAHHGPDHLILLKPLVNLGTLASRLGQHQDALAYFARATAILAAVQESDADPRIIWVQASAADAQLRNADFAAAVPGYQRALIAAEQVHGPTSAQVVRPLLGLAECEVALGQLDQARATLARAAALIELQPGRRWLFELVGHQLAWVTGDRDQRDRALAEILAVRARVSHAGGAPSMASVEIDRWLARNAPEAIPPD